MTGFAAPAAQVRQGSANDAGYFCFASALRIADWHGGRQLDKMPTLRTRALKWGNSPIPPCPNRRVAA
jgi:hypothetical protein